MLYLVIYAHISPITLVLACSKFLISYLHILSQVIGEKNEVEGLEDQGRLQKRPNKPKVEDPRQNLRTKKKPQNAVFGKRQNGRARHHHGLPVVVGRTTVLSGCMTVRPLSTPSSLVSFVAFRFPA